MIDLKRYVTISHRKTCLNIPPISAGSISIVIPAKDDQSRLDNLLNSLNFAFEKADKPLEVIIVDNNSYPELKINWNSWKTDVPLKIFVCKKKGVSAARNFGVSFAEGEWVLFCDHDCIVTSEFLSGYVQADNGAVAYAGFVEALQKDLLSKYYDSQNTLHAPDAYYETQIQGPMYVVTANALVLKKAFIEVGGFNEEFLHAAEDVDLSLKLWQIGNLSHAKQSIILHDFKNDWKDFCKRFLRYGIGNWQLELQYQVNKFPKAVFAKKVSLFNCVVSSINWICLVIGYCYGRFLKSLHNG